ncbi:cytochrome P450 71D10-like [Gastrolobium bilobum]|uniref:cytochrome P450 71D10-like n=1 Tax=Gastrolobium bilobum TaxID=150636 RepID=UPI002AB0B1E3|nr:cytochrome P450 71D10-like [Gastrolobium bilobum]
MELWINYTSLVIFFCFVFLILNTFKRSNTKKPTKNFPPGPRKLPLIGNIDQFGGSLPHQTLRDMANKYGPLMHLQLGELSNVVVSSPEIAEKIMKTHDVIFSNRPFLLAATIISYDATNIGYSPYGAYWRQLRKICTIELLSAKRVQSFSYLREEEVSVLIRTISENEGSVINLSKEIFLMTNAITARSIIGKKCKDQESFISTIEAVLNLAGGFSVADLYPSIKVLPFITRIRAKLQRLRNEIDRILDNIIKEHKENKRGHCESEEDLVDVLLSIQKQDDLGLHLTDDNLRAVLLDMFIGGSETSSTTIEWAMSELMKNPKVMQEAQAEVRRVCGSKGDVDEADTHQLKYLNSVIKETLRLHPPLPMLLPRENSESSEIMGYQIPAKTKVIVNFWAIGRDPKHWIEAEKFKPERFLDSPIDYKGTNFKYKFIEPTELGLEIVLFDPEPERTFRNRRRIQRLRNITMEEVVNNDNNGNHNHEHEQGPNEGRGPSLNDMGAPFRNGPERGPFLATGDAIINVRKGELSMSVNGEEVKFNVMKAIKFDEDNTEECSSISILDSVIREEQQEHLQPEIGMKDFEELEEYLASISFHQPQGRKERVFESLNRSEQEQRPKLPSVEQPPTLELKPLPEHLKYTYLGKDNTLPVIISSLLTHEQELQLTQKLKDYKEAIGWTMADIKGISPTICMHKILLQDPDSSSVEHQRRLNPNMKEVIVNGLLLYNAFQKRVALL